MAAHEQDVGITFREAIAEVELGLVTSEQLPDIATTGLLEGYESESLAALAGELAEHFDPVAVERLWAGALQELHIVPLQPAAAGRVLVRAYARLAVEGELPPQLAASKIAGVHHIVMHPGCDASGTGDCIDAAGVIRLFYASHTRGYGNRLDHQRTDTAILHECRRIVESAPR